MLGKASNKLGFHPFVDEEDKRGDLSDAFRSKGMLQNAMPQEEPPETIDVGATPETGLRLARAKEAMRQAETRLAFQATSLSAMEARAQAVVGWAVAGATALTGGLLIAEVRPSLQFAGGAAWLSLVASASCGVLVLAPSTWKQFGEPRKVLGSTLSTELEDLEATADGLADGIDGNNRRLDRAAVWLRWSLGFFAASPIAAVIGALVWNRWPHSLSTFGL